jgi:hypothetical protein
MSPTSAITGVCAAVVVGALAAGALAVTAADGGDAGSGAWIEAVGDDAHATPRARGKSKVITTRGRRTSRIYPHLCASSARSRSPARRLEVCRVWCERGFADTCAVKVTDALQQRLGIDHIRTQAELASAGDLPPWLGDEELHRSHRAALVRKDPEFYRPLFGDVPDDLEYVWPVRVTRSG